MISLISVIFDSSLILKATENINNVKSKKCGFVPEKIEIESLKKDVFIIKYDFCRLLKVKIDANTRKS